MLAQYSTAELRALLLALPGIGPETADDILVYAFGRPVFVVDAYARRVLSRYGWAKGTEPYEDLSQSVVRDLGSNAGELGEFHALLVEHGKRHCRTAPICNGCPLAATCRTGARNQTTGAGC